MTEARKRELQAELEGMTVHQETLVGWDEKYPAQRNPRPVRQPLSKQSRGCAGAGQPIPQASGVR